MAPWPSRLLALLLFVGSLPPAFAEDPHAELDRLPSFLDRVRVGDRGTYRVLLEEAGVAPRTVTLDVRVSALTELRCTLRIERKSGDSPTVTDLNHLPRKKRWRELWQTMMRRKGMNVKLLRSRVVRDVLRHAGKEVACQRVILDYAGTCQMRGQAIPLEARTTYWLSPAFPIQGIGKSVTSFSLKQNDVTRRYRVTMTLAPPAKRPPAK